MKIAPGELVKLQDHGSGVRNGWGIPIWVSPVGREWTKSYFTIDMVGYVFYYDTYYAGIVVGGLIGYVSAHDIVNVV